MNAKKKNKISKFKSFKEEAKFWDSHDFTDYLSDLKPVKVIFSSSPKEEILTLRLQPQFKKLLNRVATLRGLQVSSLIRMWLTEKLYQEKELTTYGSLTRKAAGTTLGAKYQPVK